MSDRPVKLAVIGDVHAHWERLEPVLAHLEEERPDGVLLVGDLGSHDLSYVRRRTPERDARYLASIDSLLERVARLGAPILWVPGNHDLPDLPGEGNVDGRVGELAGLRVGGIGGAGPDRFGFAYEWGEEAIRRRPELDCDVLLSHTPPARTPLDVVARGGHHVGSEAVRERALRHDGALVCGHIHEAPGSVQLGRCLCLNAGALGEPFGRPQVGFVVRDPSIPGGWEVAHLDLTTRQRRAWRREP